MSKTTSAKIANSNKQSGYNAKNNRGSKSAKGRKPPYRGSKPYKGNKQDRREEEIADTSAAMSRSNPVSFYTKYAEFARDAATLPFSLPLGANVDVSAVSKAQIDTPKDMTLTMPGIMRLVFTPTIGVSNGYDSPVNRSSINYFARLRSTQKAFGDYDHQDLTMMILAIDSLVMYHALGRRIYGLLTDMTPINRYYPKTLVTANGVSFAATQKQIQDFRAFLNEFAIQVEAYSIPENISLIQRHQWMCEGIYVDSESRRAQTYMFVPSGFWQYDNTGLSGSELILVQYMNSGTPDPGTSYTLEQFQEIGLNLLKSLNGDQDFATIAGDLYAYYGGKSLKLPYVDEHYQILPRFDKTVLSQIENAMVLGDLDVTAVTISQNPSVNEGAIIYAPQTLPSVNYWVNDIFMNMHTEHPTSDEVIEATRLMAVVEPYFPTGSDDIKLRVTSCGSEIVNYLDIFTINPATGGSRDFRISSSVTSATSGNFPANGLGTLAYLASFDWAPKLHLLGVTQSGSAPALVSSYYGTTWDVDNFCEIQPKQLETIHQACLYSLFDVSTH